MTRLIVFAIEPTVLVPRVDIRTAFYATESSPDQRTSVMLTSDIP